MVTQLTNIHQKDLLNVLLKDPIINCYLISDVLTFGLDHPSFKVYGQFTEHQIEAVVMFFHQYGIFYTETSVIEQELIDRISEFHPLSISGGQLSINLLLQHIQGTKVERFQLSVLSSSNADITTSSGVQELSTSDDYELLYNMLKAIPEFNVATQSKDDFVREKQILNQAGHTYGLFVQDRLCSTASTIAETTEYAVINGVATVKSERNKGYASSIIDYIIHEYLTQKNKKLILYYNQPDAAKIYHNRGFQPYGHWLTITL